MRTFSLLVYLLASTAAQADISFGVGGVLVTPPLPVNVNVQIGAPAQARRVGGGGGFYACSVSAFTDTYSATGSTRAEAKYRAQKECTENHHSMHCQDVKCDGEDYAYADASGYVCRINVFGDDFEAYGATRTEATFKVKQACAAENSSMHCTSVRCSQ